MTRMFRVYIRAASHSHLHKPILPVPWNESVYKDSIENDGESRERARVERIV